MYARCEPILASWSSQNMQVVEPNSTIWTRSGPNSANSSVFKSPGNATSGMFMVGDVVCANGPLRLAFSFVEADASDLGVRVHLEITYAGSFQILKWSVEHLWIEYAELKKFEGALQDELEAVLHDMSDYPVLHFERSTSQERLTINPRSPRQSADGESMIVILEIAGGSMRALHSSLSEFPQWW